MKLQSVELRVPDIEATARFHRGVGLARVAGNRLRGTDALPYLVGLEQGPPGILSITFCGADSEREVKGPEGEMYRFVREQSGSPLAGDCVSVKDTARTDAAERAFTWRG